MNTTAPHPQYNRALVFVIGSLAALAGLLFGVDTGIIAGALRFIAHDFHLTDRQQEWIVSAILFGALLGSLIANPMSHKIGRRRALLVSSVIFIVGSLFAASASSYIGLVSIRFLLGLSLGIASFTAPIYLSEIAPKRVRGAMVTLYQLMITIGILGAFLISTYFTATANWRAMLGVIAIPSCIMLLGVLVLPYSPRWLMLVGRREEAKKVLEKILCEPREIDRELNEIESNLTRTHSDWSVFKSPFFRRVLALGLALQFIQIMTGMNTMMYYAPKIYNLAGYVSPLQQMWGTVLLGSLNVITTVLSLFAIDRWGRRPLLFFGLIMMALGMSGLSLAFHLGADTQALQYLAVAGMLTFIFGFAISLGPIIWLMCAEIFPLRGRDMGVMFTTGMNWLCNALLGNLFLTVLAALGPVNVFLMFAILCVCSLVFVYFFVPETKNVPLEMIERHLLDGKSLRDLGQSRQHARPHH